MLVCSIFDLKDYNHNLKSLGIDILELRLDLMKTEDLITLSSLGLESNLKLLITIKSSKISFDDIFQILKKVEPDFIDVDYSLYGMLEKKIKQQNSDAKLIVSKHTSQTYELFKFFKKYPKDILKKLVIHSDNSLFALKVAKLAKKNKLILFTAGKNTSFTRFFSNWHYCYLNLATAEGQLSALTLNEFYTITSSADKFYALIGNPLDASLSHFTHNKVFKTLDIPYIYLKIPLKASDFLKGIKLLKSLGCLGLSVTTPLKSLAALHYRYRPSLNTIDLKTNKCLNTDNMALLEILKAQQVFSILIIGDGACSLGFQKILKENNYHFDVYSRKNPINCKNEYDVIINATSSHSPLLNLPKSKLLVNLPRGSFSEIEKLANIHGSMILDGQTFFYIQAIRQLEFFLKTKLLVSKDQFFSLVKETISV